MTLQITGNDIHGSPLLALSDGSCNTFTWSPFGEAAARSGITASLPGFNSERPDPFSGVTHLGNGYRAYSPALRRFTCPDSESPFGGGGINAYVYCEHDPINNIDPDGHMPLKHPAVRDAKLLEDGRRLNMPHDQAASTHVAQASTSRGGTVSSEQMANGTTDSLTDHRRSPAAPVQGFTPEEMEGALRLYTTNVGSKVINKAAHKFAGKKVSESFLAPGKSLDKAAFSEWARGHSETRLGKPEILEAAGKRIMESPSSAVSLMKEAVGGLKHDGWKTYYRGTPGVPLLSELKEGAFVTLNYFMSVTTDEKIAKKFLAGTFDTNATNGVLFEIFGNPHHMPYGEYNEKESIFNVGTMLIFTKEEKGVYSFTEATAAERRSNRKKASPLFRWS